MASLSTFLIYLFATNFSPGPNNITALSNGMRFGWRRTWPFRAGMFTGFAVVMLLCGLANVALIAAIIGCILLSANWRPGLAVDVFGTRLELQNLVRDGLLVVIALLSLWWTRDEHRAANGFSWEPIREVAKLFAGIFIGRLF